MGGVCGCLVKEPPEYEGDDELEEVEHNKTTLPPLVENSANNSVFINTIVTELANGITVQASPKRRSMSLITDGEGEKKKKIERRRSTLAMYNEIVQKEDQPLATTKKGKNKKKREDTDSSEEEQQTLSKTDTIGSGIVDGENSDPEKTHENDGSVGDEKEGILNNSNNTKLRRNKVNFVDEAAATEKSDSPSKKSKKNKKRSQEKHEYSEERDHGSGSGSSLQKIMDKMLNQQLGGYKERVKKNQK